VRQRQGGPGQLGSPLTRVHTDTHTHTHTHTQKRDFKITNKYAFMQTTYPNATICLHDGRLEAKHVQKHIVKNVFIVSPSECLREFARRFPRGCRPPEANDTKRMCVTY